MICSQCQAAGQTSTVSGGSGMRTLMYCPPFYDEQGRYHDHDRNVWLGVSVEDRKYGLPRVDIQRTIPAAVRFLSVEPLLEDLGDIDLTGIHWVIVGGESGRRARPFAIEWAQRIAEQCRAQDVPVFIKQPGDHPTHDTSLLQIRHKSDRSVLAAHGLDIRQWPKCITEKDPPCPV